MTKKRLFFDIETSPNIGFFWQSGYKQMIDYHNIIEERKIICICYKWAGDKKVYSLSWDSEKNDKKMLEDFIKVANEAVELVGHNGDKFDLTWIRTRCLFHRIDMFPNYTTIDTLKTARSKFRFNSNRLDYIAQYLGLEGKIHTDFALWKNITLHNDQKSMDKMVKYCKWDVELLEKVYDIMAKHINLKTHYGVIAGNEKYSCPACGSMHTGTRGITTTKVGTVMRRYSCYDCGRWYQVSNKVHMDKLRDDSDAKNVV